VRFSENRRQNDSNLNVIMKTIAAYCRVSTVRQKTDSQVAEIKKWLASNGHDESQV